MDINNSNHSHLCEFCNHHHNDCTPNDTKLCEDGEIIICIDCYNQDKRYQSNEIFNDELAILGCEIVDLDTNEKREPKFS